MIDEKKLIEERPEWLNPDCAGNEEYNKGWNACNKYWRNTIKRQPKVGEWIPCSERLPEKTGYYLVQLSRKLPIEDYADRVVALYNGEDKEFMTYERFIIAWQPLPEPYKGE